MKQRIQKYLKEVPQLKEATEKAAHQTPWLTDTTDTLNLWRGLPQQNDEIKEITPFDRLTEYFGSTCLSEGTKLPCPPVNLNQSWEKTKAEARMLIKEILPNIAPIYHLPSRKPRPSGLGMN